MTTTVYLIHFERKLHHAQHYIGYTANLENRMEDHRTNNGACLLRALNRQKIQWSVVRTWEGGKTLERRLKNWKKARQLCPICIEVNRNEKLARSGLQ